MPGDRAHRSHSPPPLATEDRRRTARPPARHNDGFEAIARRVLEYTARRYTEGQARSGSERDRDGPDNDQQPRRPHLETSDMARLILGQLVKYIIHRYITNRAQPRSAQSRQGRSNPRGSQPREREQDQHRLPALASRDIDEMRVSLEDLIQQLQSTEDLVQRTMYRPATHEGCGYHRSIVSNASRLHQSIGRSTGEARRVYELLGQYRRPRVLSPREIERERRRGGAEDGQYVRRP